MRVACTGHRPDKLGGWVEGNPTHQKVARWLRQQLARLQKKHLDIHLISGMALGVDTWAVDAALQLNIPYTAALPFEGQEKLWPVDAQRIYKNLIMKAHTVYYVGGPGWHWSKFHARNRWMVDQSEALLAVFDGSSGGTAHCFNYAESAGRKIIRLNPGSF
jgi:uncharacterized phage-like protein YoqJ